MSSSLPIYAEIEKGHHGEAAASNVSDHRPFSAQDSAEDGKFHLLLAASGSVATIKIPNIIRELASHPILSIRLLFSESATHFLQGQSEEQPDLTALAEYPNVDGIYRDADEWASPWVRNSPILHIELRRWAHLLVIAPLSANTLAQISNGLCDNLLTSVVRAWEVQDPQIRYATAQKRIIVAPAMNTEMWKHPKTTEHCQTLWKTFSWFDVLDPVSKSLACGDVGEGAMCDWKLIVDEIIKRVRSWKLQAT